MSVVAKKSVLAPAAAKLDYKLKSLVNEVARLRAENARLTQELEQYIEQWETLDGPQVSTLIYLCERGHVAASEIARGMPANIQIVESSLAFLLQLNYVRHAASQSASVRGKKKRFSVAPKGERYLRSRGLYKSA